MKTIANIQTIKDSQYLTVKETAEELGINTQTVRDYLTKGVFKTYKFKTLTLIDRQEVEKYKHR